MIISIIILVLGLFFFIAVEVYYQLYPKPTKMVNIIHGISISIPVALFFILFRSSFFENGLVSFLLVLLIVFSCMFLATSIAQWIEKRKVIIPDFLGSGKHVYRSDLGFRLDITPKEFGKSNKNRTMDLDGIFTYYMERVGDAIVFYDPVVENFYAIVHERDGYVIRFCRRHLMITPYLGKSGLDQILNRGESYGAQFLSVHTHSVEMGEDNLHDVLNRSYLTYLSAL